MPNWCGNELTIQGKTGVLACLEAIEGDCDTEGPRYLDFQRIVPMPAILEATCSPIDKRGVVLLGDDAAAQEMLSCPWIRAKGITEMSALRDYLRECWPEAEETAKRSIQAEQETGCRDWYEWRVGRSEHGFLDGHWGTKWNACCTDLPYGATDTRAVIRFSTAWSPPLPVILELSKLFPKLIFTLRYWEGGCGFRGTMQARTGKVLRAACHDYRGPRGG